MESSNPEDDSDHSSVCSDVLIRKARVSDVDAVIGIYSSSIDYLDAESREWIEGIIRKKSRRARIYVAIKGGKVVGFILAYKRGDRAYIDAFAVDPEHRGEGIGQCLLTYMEKLFVLEGVKKVYLTVKNNNHRALGMYLKNGYKISNVVLILKALSETMDDLIDSRDNITVKIDSVKRSTFPKVKLLDANIWSNFTWDVDEAIYRISDEEAITIMVYKGRRLLGIARACLQQNIITVERLAISFYRPTYSLKAVINAIKMGVIPRPGETIIIPVDSTKTSLLKTLISIGFRVVDSEYVLCKDLSETWQNLGAIPQLISKTVKYANRQTKH